MEVTDIKGYRHMSPEEVALINRIKEHGAATRALVEEIRAHLFAQRNDDEQTGLDFARNFARIEAAEPGRWAAIGRTHLQEGLMCLVRAVGQSEGF